MSSDGKLTAEAAIYIAEKLRGSEYEVLFDHGSSLTIEISPDLDIRAGQIVSWSGDKGSHQLGHLDIAVVEKESRKRVIVVIEIEEKGDRPKTLLGDALALLIGKSITFRGESLPIGSWTTMLVLGKRTTEQETKRDHKNRIKYLCDTIENLRQILETENSNVEKVKLETFTDGPDLQQKLSEEFDHLIVRK